MNYLKTKIIVLSVLKFDRPAIVYYKAERTMACIVSSNTEPNMGYVITRGQTILDLTLNDDVLSYNLSFWLKVFQYITDDMYINPLPRKIVKKFYVDLNDTDHDFVVHINDSDSLQKVGNKVYYKYKS